MIQVQLNVLVICICYFARFIYDLVLLMVSDRFSAMRKREANLQGGHRIYYSMFLFFLIIVVEYLPILMFTLNLRYISSKNINVIPRAIPVVKEEDRLGQKLLGEAKISYKDKRSVLSDDIYD